MTPIYNHSREPDGAGRDTPDPQTLTLGSLFDGSGGFPLGGLLSGITPVWASEIEPFPIRVTTKRLPFMKHYGDVSRMDGGKIEPLQPFLRSRPDRKRNEVCNRWQISKVYRLGECPRRIQLQ